MKNFPGILALLLSISIFSFAQSKDEKDVQVVLNEIAAALVKNDVSKLTQIWADDYTFISPTGLSLDRKQRVAALNTVPPPTYFVYSNPKIRIFGNAALVNTLVKVKNDQDTLMFHTSMVFNKSQGRWRLVNAQGTPAAMNAASGTSDQESIKKIIQEMVDALLKNDVSVDERYVAPDYVFTAPSGVVLDKTQSISDMKSGDVKFESFKVDDMKVQVYGNTAVAVYSANGKGKYKDTDISGQNRWTDTFTKQNGRWMLVARQGTRIAQQ